MRVLAKRAVLKQAVEQQGRSRRVQVQVLVQVQVQAAVVPDNLHELELVAVEVVVGAAVVAVEEPQLEVSKSRIMTDRG